MSKKLSKKNKQKPDKITAKKINVFKNTYESFVLVDLCHFSPRPFPNGGTRTSLSFRYLFQVIKLHGDLSEKEVDVRPPLHSTDEERLCIGQKKKKKVQMKVLDTR